MISGSFVALTAPFLIPKIEFVTNRRTTMTNSGLEGPRKLCSFISTSLKHGQTVPILVGKVHSVNGCQMPFGTSPWHAQGRNTSINPVSQNLPERNTTRFRRGVPRGRRVEVYVTNMVKTFRKRLRRDR